MRSRHRLSIASVASLACCLLASSPAIAASPTIERQWVSAVTSTDATLNAEIDSNGLATRYELQIDTTGNFRFDQNSSCPLEDVPMWCLALMVVGDPLPAGLVQPPEFDLRAADKAEHVSINMASIGATLQPGTTYHYRAIAANGEVVVEGPEQTFTTPPATGPPTIETQWVTGVTHDDATLHAQINPNGLPTKYMLQIDTTGNFRFHQHDSCVLHPVGALCLAAEEEGDPLFPGLMAPLELELEADHDSQEVSVDLSDAGAVLQPNTTYHYRAIAANGHFFQVEGSGEWTVLVAGADQTFTTPSESPVADRDIVPDSIRAVEPEPTGNGISEGPIVEERLRPHTCKTRKWRRSARREGRARFGIAGRRCARVALSPSSVR
jgi:hypothetical protein